MYLSLPPVLNQLRQKASEDQRKAMEREDRGIRRRMRALVAEHGTDTSKERLAQKEAQEITQEQQRLLGSECRALVVSNGRDDERAGSRRVPGEEPVALEPETVSAGGGGRSKAADASEASAEISAERAVERREPAEKGAERRRSIGEGMSRSVAQARRRRRVSGEM